jgi:hypothetical protein
MAKIIDGIINKELYEKAKYKILWILKEGNVDKEDPDEERNLCDEINDIVEDTGVEQHRKNARAIPTFRKVIYASYGILYPEVSWLDIPLADEGAYDVFKEIAYININNEPGGSVSDNDKIRKKYTERRCDLLKQIKAINPQIIIFGGTEQFFSEVDLKDIGWYASSKDRFTANAPESDYTVTCYSKSKDKLIICPVHPAYFGVSDRDYCTSIHQAVLDWQTRFE